MTKEKIKQEAIQGFKEGGLASPIVPSGRNLDAINVDNPKEIPQELTGENFDALIEIYKLLNSPEAETRLRIEYGQAEDGKKTVTVFVDGQRHYFTDSAKEIENFHSWSENKHKRKEVENKKSN